MSSVTESNKRIAKNTFFLYIRTFIIMFVTLYTSRVVLQTLWETDFGIYNIVGSVVVLFSFLNSAMSSATLRFLNYELGRKNINGVKRIFSMSLTAYITIALLIVVLAETIGAYFVYTKLNIPKDRFIAALWVYHFSILSCCVSILRIPYNAIIIAYERMSFYAYISIVEAVLKLLLVYLLLIVQHDKLILYSILMFVVVLIMNLAYKYFCNKKFSVSHYSFFWDAKLYKELVCFSGWSMLGSLANVGSNQGVNIVINVFCGVAVNAAMGIAHQVHAAVNTFIANFQTAFVPQIIKSYAEENRNYFLSLIFRTSRFSYFLIFLIGFPLILCCRPILEFWLTVIPKYAVEFTQLIVIFCMIDAVSGPLWNSVQATGKIRNYQILISILISLNIPVSFALLYFDFSPVYVIIAKVGLNILTLLVRVLYLGGHVGLPVKKYFKEVILRIIYVTACAIPIPICFQLLFEDTLHFINTFILSGIISLLVIYRIGLTVNERMTFVLKMKKCYFRVFHINN